MHWRIAIAVLLSEVIHETTGSKDTRAGRTRIINGEKALQRWPFMVQIQMNGGHLCGGSLIQPDVVLTAGHCFIPFLNDSLSYGVPPSRGRYEVVLGTNKVPKQGDTFAHERNAFTDVARFSHFDMKRPYNDIGLLLLKRPVSLLQEHIGLVKVPRQGETQPDSSVNCTIMGWGSEHTLVGWKMTDDLRQASVNVQTWEYCHSKWELFIGITKHMVCAGKRKWLAFSGSTYNGDSGGPLVCQYGNVWKQVGVTSFGNPFFAGLNFAPGIFTKVSSFIDWTNKEIPLMRQRRHDRETAAA